MLFSYSTMQRVFKFCLRSARTNAAIHTSWKNHSKRYFLYYRHIRQNKQFYFHTYKTWKYWFGPQNFKMGLWSFIRFSWDLNHIDVKPDRTKGNRRPILDILFHLKIGLTYTAGYKISYCDRVLRTSSQQLNYRSFFSVWNQMKIISKNFDLLIAYVFTIFILK